MVQFDQQEPLPSAQHEVMVVHEERGAGPQQGMLAMAVAVGALVQPAHVHRAHIHLVVPVRLVARGEAVQAVGQVGQQEWLVLLHDQGAGGMRHGGQHLALLHT